MPLDSSSIAIYISLIRVDAEAKSHLPPTQSKVK